jgi:hypothetical protein
MTLLDHETEKDIVNPYITIYSFFEDRWVSLNTETFRDAQKELISVYDEKTQMELGSKKLYPVVATVGKQDHLFDYESRIAWTRGVRSEGANDALALIPLGYLLEDVVEKLFPNSFEKLKRKKSK